MNIQQARYDGAPYRLRADMALMRGDFAKRETRIWLYPRLGWHGLKWLIPDVPRGHPPR